MPTTYTAATPFDADIARILAKLDKVRKRGLHSFGWERHGFTLQSVLSEAEVQGFERQHAITLPEDFRRFLLCAGGSGAGPYFGLLPIRDWVTDDRNLAADYPFVPDSAPPHPNVSGTDQMTDRNPRDGAITIVNQGCAYAAILVVSGPHRGRLANICEDSADEPCFTADAGFLAWYERWLDEMLAGWDTTWFGFGLPGDARKMQEVLISPAKSAHEKAQALRTVQRIPQLDEPLMDAVYACLSHADAGVRALSAFLMGKHRVQRAERALLDLCDDPDPEVRNRALRSLPQIGCAQWPATARHALDDTEERVFFAAHCLLAEAKLLTREDLEPHVASALAWKRRSAIDAWGTSGFKVSDAPWLEARISDEDREVRRSVILAASRADDVEFLPRLEEMRKREGGEFGVLVANVRRNLREKALQEKALWVFAIIAVLAGLGFMVRRLFG
jgi:hypothetical protein